MQYGLPRCLCVIYPIESGLAQAIFEFLIVAQEIGKKDHVVNLAMYDSFPQISRFLDRNFQNFPGAATSITKTYLFLKFWTHAILVGSRGRCWGLESLLILYCRPVCSISYKGC